MLNHEYKCIFVHIPKTAGTYIKRILGFQKKDAIEKHAKPDSSWYKNYWDNYFTFTFVRNPYDRLVSGYFYMGYGNKKWKTNIKNKGHLPWFTNKTFEDFVLNTDFEELKNINIFEPQINWYKENINFIGRVENIDEDLVSLNLERDIYFGNEIYILKNPFCGKINQSKHGPWQSYYENDKVKKKVYNWYKKDFETFGYSVDV